MSDTEKKTFSFTPAVKKSKKSVRPPLLQIDDKQTPKQMILAFVKQTSGEDKTFIFTVPGNEHEAIKFLHRMRVELSRFRKLIVEKNKTPIPFTMYKKSIVQEKGYTTICLVRDREKGLSKETKIMLDALSDET